MSAPVFKNTAPLRIAVVLGSVRVGRNAERVGKYVVRRLKENGHDIDLFDPKDINLPLLDIAHHHYAYIGKEAPAELTALADRLKAADAYVIVSSEYNHSIPAALTNFLSYFSPANFMYKPSGIVCYSMGPFGGVRASMQLRSFLGELGLYTVPQIVPIPVVHQALGEDGVPTNPEQLDKTFDSLRNQLEWAGHATSSFRKSHGVPQ